MRTRWISVAATLSVAAAIAAGGAISAADNEAASEPQVFNVLIDGKVDEFNGSFFAYYPSHLTAHAGDTIVFTSVFTGEPHTITFGSTVQDIVEPFMTLTPAQQAFEEEPPPDVMAALDAAMAVIPPMLPEGPGDANQASVNPCFVPEGDAIPTDPAAMCEVTQASPFTGTEVFYSSGFLPDAMTFEMPLADDLAPGTYFGYCTLHSVGMIFTLEIVAADEPTLSPDEVAAAGLAELEGHATAVAPAIDEALAMNAEMPTHVMAGAGSPAVPQALVSEFLPQDITVPVGEAVTWTVIGPHTISFGAPESARTLLAQGEDGGYHLNPEGLSPAGFEPPASPEGETVAEGTMSHGSAAPDASAAPEGPPAEEGPPPPIDAGTYSGEGFFNSGIMFGGDFVLRFDTPGTYPYDCLVHPDMQGTITVE